MKTKTLLWTMILTAIILTPMALAAPDGPGRGQDGPRQGRGGGFGGGNFAQMLLGRMGEELNLTDEQKESIKKISDESKSAVQEGRETVWNTMQALNEAAEKGTEAEIIAAGKAAGDALTQQALKRAEISKKIKAVLTDEQKTKLDEIRAEMREQMEQMRQQRREERQDGEGFQRKERGHRYGNSEDDDNNND